MGICDLPALAQARALAAGELSCAELMAETLDRIEAMNPALNAIVSLRPREELLAEARAADAAPRRGWLHGLPLAPKDLVAVKGLRSTFGSRSFAEFVPAADDLVAARMRAAGGIFIGKTNTPEWGLGSHTFNEVFGPTRNPYDLSRSPGGSSGGAAAALAARLLPVADGSDMMGSLRNPAAFCNVYGFRPSWGLVPSDGPGDAFMATLAVEGPMGRTVEDVAALLGVLAGPEPGVPFPLAPERYDGLGSEGLHGKRVGWLADMGAYPMEPGILALCEAGLRVMGALGAEVIPLPPPMPAAELWEAWTTLRAFLNANGKRGLYDSPATRAHLKPEAVWEIEQGIGLSTERLHAASLVRTKWYRRLARLFEEIDFIALPAAQVWPFAVETRWPGEINGMAMDTYHRWMEVVVPVSLAGLPCLSLPMGFGDQGLPMGLQLAGPHGRDRSVLEAGQHWHLATDWPGQRPPRPSAR